ncbi:ATP-binding protein [Actinocorallia sp. B10E7]|uniref:ATP-binding protein n=1 Tax=Actinocorallia sp. B10E7 TaxID=3153558 RepID=UPI00325D6248
MTDETTAFPSAAASEPWCAPDEGDGSAAERVFLADLEQVRTGRAWLREVLPSDCPLRDDCVLVLSELLANAAEHGGRGPVKAIVTHGAGRLRGVLVQRAAPWESTGPRISAPALLEIERLLGTPVGRMTDVEGLAESGRGLAVVAALCSGALEFERQADRTVIRWELRRCACTLIEDTTGRLRKVPSRIEDEPSRSSR